MPLPGPQFFYRGGFYNSPRQIQMLRFNQRRSHLYPRDPYFTAQALQPEQPAAQYLPQRMAFTRWKTPPTRVAWGENAAGVVAATAQAPAQVSAMEEAAGLPPMLPFWDAPAALGADGLPEAPVADFSEQPISRGVLPHNRMQLHAGELSALVREQREGIARGHRGAQDRRDLAMAEVSNQVSAVTRLVQGGESEDAEWYL